MRRRRQRARRIKIPRRRTEGARGAERIHHHLRDGTVTLHDIAGGGGQNAGTVFVSGKIGSVTVVGDVLGGAGAGSGSVFSGFDAAFAGDIGAVKIGGRLEGGAEANSGSIVATGKIASVTIGSTTSPGELRIKGGAGDWSGAIFSRGGMGAVKIFGHVEGGEGDFSGRRHARRHHAGDRARRRSGRVIVVSRPGGEGDPRRDQRAGSSPARPSAAVRDVRQQCWRPAARSSRQVSMRVIRALSDQGQAGRTSYRPDRENIVEAIPWGPFSK